jgi:hypothetical protein
MKITLETLGLDHKESAVEVNHAVEEGFDQGNW